jgi:hypothetical protein
MNIYKIFLLSTLFFNISVAAMQQVVVQTKSESGKTLKLNIGTLQGVKTGDFADFTQKSGTLDVPRYSLIGPGRVLKVFQNYSYWYFPHAQRKNLTLGKPYQLLIRRKSLQGRTDVSIDYRVSAYQNDRTRKNRKHGERSDFPKDLIQQSNTFEKNVYKDSAISDADYREVKDISMDQAADQVLDADYMEVQFLRSDTNVINRKTLAKDYKDKLAREQHTQQIDKINKLKYGYDELYYEVEDFNDGRGAKRTRGNYLSEVREEESKLSKIPKETLSMIQKNGKSWSSDMDDDDLKNYLLKTGVAKEQKRRNNVLTLQSGNEVILYLGSNLSANYLPDDENYQFRGFSMGVGYDLHLVRISQGMVNWSLDVKFERGSISVGQRTLNSRIIYGAFGAHLNYYFSNYPHSRNRFAWYVGAGMKRGNGEGENTNLTGKYEYEIQSIPTGQIGVKYRMAAGRDYEFNSTFGFGFNAKLSYEMLSVKTINNVQDDFDPNQTVGNARLDIGLSIYF